MAERVIRYYRNELVKRVLAFIPPGHMHVRFVIEFCDQTIILNEATIAGIVRAYIDITTHPQRKALELIIKPLDSSERKHGYAKWQLVETVRCGDEIVREGVELLSRAIKPEGCNNTSMITEQS